MKKVTSINIVRPYLPALEEISGQFQECLRTGMVTNNSCYVRSFEERLHTLLGSELLPVAHNNGEMALYNLILAWKAKLGFGPHESFDVLVPSFTFSGTVNAIVACNLRPIFCDIDETLTLDVTKIGKVPRNGRMIVAVSVYGNVPNIPLLKEFSNRNRCTLIFDNAPAFGSTYNKQPLQSYQIEEIYSFHATKIVSCMEGGAAITNDEDVRKALMCLRDFGQYEKERGDVRFCGLNSKMQEISAIVGLANLDRIETIIEKRKKVIHEYRLFFRDLEERGRVKLMQVREEVFCPYLYFPVILKDDRTVKRFILHMNEHSIAVRRYYTAVHDLTFYKGKYPVRDLAVTEGIKDRIVAIPLHTEMNDEEIAYLFKTISVFFQHEEHI